ADSTHLSVLRKFGTTTAYSLWPATRWTISFLKRIKLLNEEGFALPLTSDYFWILSVLNNTNQVK
ncbi:MAG: hypothetical protein WAZ77_16080, partial [Candidatus Nitrosopolaris sp.]